MASPIFTQICRTCLSKKGNMRQLFGSCLDTMLSAVAAVQVEPGDGLPETVCVQCVLQISRAFNFKQVCQRSDLNLRQLYLDSVAANQVSNEEVAQLPVLPSANESDQMAQPEMFNNNYEDESAAANDKYVLIVHHMSLLDEDTGDQLLMGDIAGGGAEVNDELAQIEHEMDIADAAENDIIDLVSLLPTEDRDLHSEFDTYSSDACGHSDTDADQLLVTVAPSLIFDLQEHRAVDDHSESPFACLECGVHCNSPQELTDHQNESHCADLPDANQFYCEICQKGFGEAKILRRHMKIHSPHKAHVCVVCEKSFAESSNLTKHMKKHTGELRNTVGKPNLCSVCGKGFKWSSSLSKHMKHHTKHKLLQCPICPKYYVEARSLNIHIRSHTGEKPFVCEICHKGFTQMGNLDKHMRVHTGEKPYLCPVCGKGFSQSGYVAIHLRTHTGEKPYQCNECGKGFAGSNTLTIHKRTHTGERPYACTVCEKTFARQETAMIHQRTHTGEKPHVCPTCNRGFTSSGHLTGHMRSHTGLKPHECTVCHKKFAGTSSLKVHLKSHTLVQDQVYSCSVCDEKFIDPVVLEDHEIEHVLADESALLQANVHDGVLDLVDDTMMLGHDLIDATDHQNCV